MREILFRGKEKDGGSYDGRWIYGDLVRIKERISDDQDDQYEIKIRIFQKNRGYLVDSETVGEYTGLTDKKGKKIFEGDIVKGYFNDKLIRGVVVYGNDATFFIQRKGLCGTGLNNGEIWIEVIGNIHDNPELLEEKGK